MRLGKLRDCIRAVISLLLLCVGHSSGLTASTAMIGSKVAGTADVSPDAIMVVLHRILGHLQQVMETAKVPLEPQQSPHGSANIVVSSPDLRDDIVSAIISAIKRNEWGEVRKIVDSVLEDGLNKIYLHMRHMDKVNEALNNAFISAVDAQDNTSEFAITDLRKKIEKLLNPEDRAHIKASEELARKLMNEEYNNSEQFIQGILIPKLNQLDYEIKDVRGDGSCGFYSILQCLHPENDFSKVQKYSEEWYLAAMLRLIIAHKSKLHNLAEMTEATEENQMGANALPYVAKFYQQTVLMIDSTTSEFRVYSADKASNEIPYEIVDFVDLDNLFFKSKSLEKPIILLYVPMHWKAIVKKIH